jgi:hypothetical protein
MAEETGRSILPLSSQTAGKVPSQQERAHARALVAEMVDAGEWPEPELLESIVNLGEAAVEPLLDVLRSPPREATVTESVWHAIHLLGVLGRPKAVPELIKIIDDDEWEMSVHAADALANLGKPGFDALFSLCSSPSLTGYERFDLLEAAANAAGADPTRRAIVAELVRPMLDQAIIDARKELKANGFLKKIPRELLDDDEDADFEEADDDGIDDELPTEAGFFKYVPQESPPEPQEDADVFEDDEDEDDELGDSDIFIAETIGHFVDVLAALADPLARETIMAAFDDDLVDESIITRSDVIKAYDNPAGASDPDDHWLDSYREDYQAHVGSLSPAPAPPATTPRPKYRYQDRYDEGEPDPDVPPTLPIRNTAPKLGRNDPCWCGSGKKFKKCHLGKEPQA